MISRPYLLEEVGGKDFNIMSFFSLLAFMAVIGLWLYSARGLVGTTARFLGIAKSNKVTQDALMGKEGSEEKAIFELYKGMDFDYEKSPTVEVNSRNQKENISHFDSENELEKEGSPPTLKTYVIPLERCQLIEIFIEVPDIIIFENITIDIGKDMIINSPGCSGIYKIEDRIYKAVTSNMYLLDPISTQVGFWRD